MNRHIASFLVICMMLSFVLFSTPTAAAESWTLPEGTPMYEPYVMDLDFGSLTLLEVGFAKKVQAGLPSIYDKDPKTIYYTAKDGFSIFAVKGILHNSSDSALELGPVQPKISYGPGDKWIGLYGYPIEPMGSPESHTLIPGDDVEIVFACEAPNAMYFGGMDLLMEVGGRSLGFRRDNLKSFVSIGFTDEDGAPTGDITMLSGEEKKTEEPIQTEKPQTDYFRFSDAKFVTSGKEGVLLLDYKIECLFPGIEGKDYPYFFSIEYQLLDKDGASVYGNDIVPYYMSNGDIAWATSIPTGKTTDKYISIEDSMTYKAVKFTGFKASVANGGGQYNYKFDKPIVLEIHHPKISTLQPPPRPDGKPSDPVYLITDY